MSGRRPSLSVHVRLFTPPKARQCSARKLRQRVEQAWRTPRALACTPFREASWGGGHRDGAWPPPVFHGKPLNREGELLGDHRRFGLEPDPSPILHTVLFRQRVDLFSDWLRLLLA